MSSSNCCFLTCIQISQEAGQVVCYSFLFQNFLEFVVIHAVKGFGIVNKAEVDIFLELSCFFDDPTDVYITAVFDSFLGKTDSRSTDLHVCGEVPWVLLGQGIPWIHGRLSCEPCLKHKMLKLCYSHPLSIMLYVELISMTTTLTYK